jgi:phage baseplate assembly protein gpV
MISGNQPDIDPANNDSLAGTIRFAFSKLLQGVNGVLPAQVIKYDRTTNRVQVQLLIAVVTTSGATVSRPQIASIPVLVSGGGGGFLSFNLVPGNLGWVVANDRDISLFLQSYAETPPNTGRIKNFADSVFIPDIMHDYVINSDDDNATVLSTIDGTVRISVSQTGIRITSPGGTTITSPSIVLQGDITMDGNMMVSGTSLLSGVVTMPAGAGFAGSINITGLGIFPFVISP